MVAEPVVSSVVVLRRCRGRVAAMPVAFLLGLATALLAVVGAPTAGAAATTRPTVALYNAAQHDFASGNITAGLSALERAMSLDPRETSVLALRAFWSNQAMDYAVREDSLNRLGALDPGRAARVRSALNAISAAALTPPDPFPSIQGSRTAIVVLGYGLRPDGSMRRELISRLQSAWVQAVAAPFSPIITTGGNPRHGIAEGAAMAGWLIGHGIPASRIHPETEADSTVQNALRSAAIIHSVGASDAVLVSSANHIRRGMADFMIAGVPVVGAMATTGWTASRLLPPAPDEQRAMYLDATSVFGLPATL